MQFQVPAHSVQSTMNIGSDLHCACRQDRTAGRAGFWDSHVTYIYITVEWTESIKSPASLITKQINQSSLEVSSGWRHASCWAVHNQHQPVPSKTGGSRTCLQQVVSKSWLGTQAHSQGTPALSCVGDAMKSMPAELETLVLLLLLACLLDCSLCKESHWCQCQCFAGCNTDDASCTKCMVVLAW